jgi:hypothetical protein
MKSQKTNLSTKELIESISKLNTLESFKSKNHKPLEEKHNRCILIDPDFLDKLLNSEKHLTSHGNRRRLDDFYTFLMMHNAALSANLKHRLDEDYVTISPNFMSIGNHERKNGIRSANIFRDDLYTIIQRGYKNFANDKLSYGAKIEVVIDPKYFKKFVFGNIEKVALLVKDWSNAKILGDKKTIKKAKKAYSEYYNKKSKSSKKLAIESIIDNQLLKNDVKINKLHSIICPGLRKNSEEMLEELYTKCDAVKRYNDTHENKREIRSIRRKILSLQDILNNTTENDEYIYYSNTKDTGREYSNLAFLPKDIRKELFIDRLGLTEFDLPSASQRILYKLFRLKFDLKGLKFVAEKKHIKIVDEFFTVNGEIDKRKRLAFTINGKTVYKKYEECKTDLKQVIQAYTFGATRIQSGCQYLRLNKLFCALEKNIKSEIKLLCDFLRDDEKMKELLENNKVLNFSDVEFDDEKTRLAKLFQSVETIVINGMKKNLFSDYLDTDMFRLHDAIYIKTQSDKKKVNTKRFNKEFDYILDELRENTKINVF